MQRSWQETMSFSALPTDWIVSNAHNRLYASLRDPGVDAERWLFPGALALLLGAGALIVSPDRRALRIPVAWILLGFFGSLGLHNILHRFLFTHVPCFRATRVPARWAVIAYVGLAILVAIGSTLIARRRQWIYAVIAAAFVVELWSAPVLWYMAVPDVPPIDRWIAEKRPHAIIELPLDPITEYGVMFHATAHHVPFVNGFSGFFPPEYVRIAKLAASWSDALADELRNIGVSHVIVHAESLDAAGSAW